MHAIAFSDKNELKGRYADTTRENFARTMVISCFSFTEAAQARRRADAERRRDADADLNGGDARDAELQRDGAREGGARSLGALSRGRFRPRSASASMRSRPARSARSPAPASAMRARCSRSSRSTAPLGRGVTLEELGGAGALSAVGPVRRRDRRNPFRRFRLQHDRDAASGRAEGPRAGSGANVAGRRPEPLAGR